MKTATVTWISYNNYGTILQAYALQIKIEQLGFENTILDDTKIIQNQFVKKRRGFIHQTEPISVKERIIGLVTDLPRIKRSILCRVNRKRYILPYEESQKRITEFKWDTLKIDKKVSANHLERLNDKYDIFIAGSDQIWSVFPDVFNPYYYLSFTSKKKISYGPSLGTDIMDESIQAKIKELLTDYAAISVREKSSKYILSSILGRDVVWVVDPVLLHDKDFWASFGTKPKFRRKYLLCYFLENKDWYFQYAKKLAKRLHLKIVLIPSKWDFLSNRYVFDGVVGIKEFVGLFANADFVLTDSYHGSLFSLLFEKNFHHLLRFGPDDENSQNIRIDSLFTELDINERIVNQDSQSVPGIEMDYSFITSKINELRKESIDYLENSLSEDK